jgi:hypothetical protein
MAILPSAGSVNRLMVLGMPGGCRAPSLKMHDAETIATKRPWLLAATPKDLRMMVASPATWRLPAGHDCGELAAAKNRVLDGLVDFAMSA